MKKLFYFSIFLFMVISVSAQSDTLKNERKLPTLNGHAFPSVALTENSFVATSLQADLGFGKTSPLRIGGIKIGDHEIFSFEGQLLFLSMEVRYQQRFNPWLAMYMSFTMAGRLGTDMSMIFADGVNTIAGGDIGWLIRIKQTRKFNLSTKLFIQNLSGNFINVRKYFEDLIDDVPNPQVVNKVPAMNVGIGVQGAYAFNPMFGLQFHIKYAYGEAFDRENTSGYIAGGLLGDVDFMPGYDVPIGFVLGYTLSSAPDILMSEGGYANIIIGKIGYTGSDDFELGLQYSFYKVNISSVESKPNISLISLGLKFYF